MTLTSPTLLTSALLACALAAPVRAAETCGACTAASFATAFDRVEVRGTLGGAPRAVLLVDLDGDDRLDLVTANRDSNTVSVMLARRGGRFAPARQYTVGTRPLALASVDADGDGHADVVALNNGSGDVSLRLGDGTGALAGESRFSACAAPSAIAAGDLDGDGRADLAVACASTLEWVALLTGGGNDWGAPQTRPTGSGSATGVRIADLDGDQVADVVLATTAPDTLTVLFGHGDGTFAAPAVTATTVEPIALTLSDFDGDARRDVAVLGPKTVRVHLGDGIGGWAAVWDTGVGTSHPLSRASAMAAGDLNGDGRADLVVTDSVFPTEVLLATGGGAFSKSSIPALSVATDVAIGDVQPDGHPDLLVALPDRGSMAGSVAYVEGNERGLEQLNTQAGAKEATVTAVADFNGDRFPDIAVSNAFRTTVVLLLANGFGGFEAPREITYGGSSPQGLAAADFNGDGRMDLAIGSGGLSNGDLRVLLGDGRGGLQPVGTPMLVAANPLRLAAADMDGDGIVDLVSSNIATAEVRVLRGTGDGTFADWASIPVPEIFTAIAADMDEDGRLDIIVSSHDGTETYWAGIHRNDGGGQFTRTSPPVRLGWASREMTTGDFDEDGHLDVAVGITSPESVLILRGDGQGSLALAGAIATPGGPARPVHAADVNGDAHLDLVTSSVATTVLVNDGHGNFTVTSYFADDSSSSAVGDFDADGRPDIAVQVGLGWGRLTVLRNTSCTPRRVRLGTVPDACSARGPLSVVTAEVTDDGNNLVCEPRLVTARLEGAPDAWLSGILTVEPVNGVAEFGALSLEGRGTGARLRYSMGSASIMTPPFTVTPPLPVAGPDLLCSGVPAAYQAGPGFDAYAWQLDGNALPASMGTTVVSSTIVGKHTLEVSGTFGACTTTATRWLEVERPVSISVEDATVLEGDSGTRALTFAARLHRPAACDVTVRWATQDGTAKAGADYLPSSGTLTFPMETTAASLFVPVVSDVLRERDETFDVVLSGAAGGTLSRNGATGTIVDDDAPMISVSDAVATERNRPSVVTATFQVTLSMPSAGTVSCSFSTWDGTATAGEDYASRTGTVTFLPGETRKSIPIRILNDRAVEATETFALVLSGHANARVARAVGRATILDDDSTRTVDVLGGRHATGQIRDSTPRPCLGCPGGPADDRTR